MTSEQTVKSKTTSESDDFSDNIADESNAVFEVSFYATRSPPPKKRVPIFLRHYIFIFANFNSKWRIIIYGNFNYF